MLAHNHFEAMFRAAKSMSLNVGDRAQALSARRKQRKGVELSAAEAEALRRYHRTYTKASVKIYLQDLEQKRRFMAQARRRGQSLGTWIRDQIEASQRERKSAGAAVAQREAALARMRVERNIANLEKACLSARLAIYEREMRAANLDGERIERLAYEAEEKIRQALSDRKWPARASSASAQPG
jgi:hypothetical protein